MTNSKYGRIVAEYKEFGEDEPVFLLRAQDLLAPNAVEAYANLVRASSVYKTDARDAETLRELADECENVAAGMRVWQSNNPDSVKLPD
jgi:hypothetical protein